MERHCPALGSELITAHSVTSFVSDGIEGVSKDSRAIDFARVGWHAPSFYALQLNSLGHSNPLALPR
jgi:hypothetical protein